MEVKKGDYLVLYNPNKNLPVNISVNQNSTLFSIFISIKKFHKLFSEDADNIHFLKDENISEKYYHKSNIPNSTLLILNELRRFDNSSSTKKLFLKAKIYELFSYIFNKNRDLNVEQCPYLTNEENFKKIKKAKEINFLLSYYYQIFLIHLISTKLNLEYYSCDNTFLRYFHLLKNEYCQHLQRKAYEIFLWK
jgi:hypothetical protein